MLSPWLELPGAGERIASWSAISGLDLAQLGTTATAEEITDTAVTQPLVVAATLLAHDELTKRGLFADRDLVIADGVARDGQLGTGEEAAPGQLLVGEQCGGDNQGLGDGGVGDLFGGGGGAQAGEVQATDRRPGGEALGGTGQFQPGGEHPRSLRTLSGSEQGYRGVLRHVIKRTL